MNQSDWNTVHRHLTNAKRALSTGHDGVKPFTGISRGIWDSIDTAIKNVKPMLRGGGSTFHNTDVSYPPLEGEYQWFDNYVKGFERRTGIMREDVIRGGAAKRFFFKTLEFRKSKGMQLRGV